MTIHAYASRLRVKPDDSMRVAVAIDIEDGWHLYGHNPEADFLVPTTVALEPGPGLTVGETQRPAEHRAMDPILKQTLNTYTGRIWFHVPVEVRVNAKPGALTLALNMKTQACDASRCLQPQTTTLRIPIQIDPDASSAARHGQIFQENHRHEPARSRARSGGRECAGASARRWKTGRSRRFKQEAVIGFWLGPSL